MKHFRFFIILLACSSCEYYEIEEPFLNYGSYAVIGDSISYGKGSVNTTSWSAILKESLGIVRYQNYSVCGAVASTRDPNSRYSIKAQIESIESNFDLITVMIGINDCLLGRELVNVEDVIKLPMNEIDYKESFTHGFVYNMSLLKGKFPDSQIIVVAPPQIGYDTKISLNEYIEIEKIVSQRLDLPFIDVSDSDYIPCGDLICPDQIHPTDKGYKLLAEFIIKQIKSIVP